MEHKEVLTDHADASRLHWKREARDLAKREIAFVLVDFHYLHHWQFYEELANNYNLKSHLNKDRTKAFFGPEKRH